jgi:hypothetical protein
MKENVTRKSQKGGTSEADKNNNGGAITTKPKKIIRRQKKSKAFDLRDYRTLPALAAYIDRVGAEQRSFRRFVIKQEGREHYHYDAVIIEITKERKIKCSDEEHGPTPKEEKAIEAELKNVEFPVSIAGLRFSTLWPARFD